MRPTIKLGIINEEWNAFSRRWTHYRAGCNISDNDATTQLLECASEELCDMLLRAHPDFASKPIDAALKVMKSLAVVPVALGVLRSELWAIHQDADEPFRKFAARVQGKAEVCEFVTQYSGKCGQCEAEYSGTTYYVDEMIRDVLLDGIADIDIRREALSVEGMQTKSVNEIIAFVESRETARNANQHLNISAISNSRWRGRPATQSVQPKRNPSPSAEDKAKTAACPDCNAQFHLFTKKPRGWNKNPHERCQQCWVRNRNAQRKDTRDNAQNSSISVGAGQFGQISSLSSPVSVPSPKRRRRRLGSRRKKGLMMALSSTPAPILNVKKRKRGPRRRAHPSIAVLSHHVFTKAGWRRARLRDHPKVTLSISPEQRPTSTASVVGLADSGAQVDAWSMEEYLKAGFRLRDLQPVSTSLNAANESPISIDGAFFATITGIKADATPITCKTMVYVSKSLRGFYLSEATMMDLGMLSRNFPTPGCALAKREDKAPDNTHQDDTTLVQSASIRAVDEGCSSKRSPSTPSCDCPVRESVPSPPSALPFPCTSENNLKMKEWLLKRYSSSTFNTCPHRPMPCMAGPISMLQSIPCVVILCNSSSQWQP